MRLEIQRWLIPANGPDVKAVKQAFNLTIKLCEDVLTDVKEIALLVPVKENLKHSTIEDALTEDICRSLLKGKSIPITNKSSLKLYTQRTFKRFSVDLVVCIYADDKLLGLVDDLIGPKACIVVPWLMEDIKEWARTWNPKILGQENQAPTELILEPVVIAALKSLTNRVNLSTGLSHPSDKEAADQMFRILKRNKYHLDPGEIRAWALRNGWSSRGADQLKKLAEKILKLKRVVISKRPVWNERILEMWKKEIE
ncbi:MAG: hypothetical protein PVG03_16555 [Desulfarculaceae bacterium]|jgi:hypothetical protein